MKALCGTASAVMLTCAFIAEAQGNTGGALGALAISTIWFIGYCYAD